MAAIGMMLGSAIANAVTFIGGNYLMSLVNPSDAGAEAARHNQAMEELGRANAEWAQKRQTRLDYLNEQLKREAHADKVYSDVNEAARLYYEVTGGDQEKQKNIPDDGKLPTLGDFYQPSDEQKKYELIFLAGATGLSGWLAFRYL